MNFAPEICKIGPFPNSRQGFAEMDTNTLTAEALQSHSDAVTAANALKLSAFLAGRNLLKLKQQLGAQAWKLWLDGECPIPKAAVDRYLRVGRSL